MNRSSKKKKVIFTALFTLFWLILWEVFARILSNSFLIAGPVDTVCHFISDIKDKSFYVRILGTVLSVLAGFVSGFVLGIILGGLSAGSSMVKMFLSPLLLVMKSVPIASFVIIVLVLFGGGFLTPLIVFIITFPIFYQSVLTSFGDRNELVEMGLVMHIRRRDRICYLYRELCRDNILGACHVAVGMGFKSGVAAEVIGIVKDSVGGGIYESKLYLDTAGVLSWTLTVLLLSYILEKILIFLIRKLLTSHGIPKGTGRSLGTCSFDKEKETYLYEDGTGVELPGLDIKEGETIRLEGASGKGKTTLMRSLWQSEDAAVLFQEDRLLKSLTPVQNVSLTVSKENKERVCDVLLTVLPEKLLNKKTEELSGGEKRRTAIVRAMLAGSKIILLDEPFTGLDSKAREKVRSLVESERRGRAVIYSAHDKEDETLCNAEKVLEF